MGVVAGKKCRSAEKFHFGHFVAVTTVPLPKYVSENRKVCYKLASHYKVLNCSISLLAAIKVALKCDIELIGPIYNYETLFSFLAPP